MNIVTIDRAELLSAIRHDCVSFLAFYIGEELTLEVPQFHEEIWEELLSFVEQVNQPHFIVGHLHKLFAVPREHSKSTLAKLAVILFMRYSILSFTLYVSRTGPIAKRALKDVVAWITSPQEVDLYGTPIEVKANESEGLWIYSIGLPGGGRKIIILLGMGTGQQIRGTLIQNKRPDLVILDDIEDYETADGGFQQDKLDEWVLGSLLKATARRSFRLFIGNMVRSTTLLARLSRDPEWNPTVFGALVRDKVTGSLRALWDGRWTVAALLADYRKYRRIGKGHIWETEMMNLSGDKLLQMSLDGALMIPHPNPEEVECGFICLDPAFGKRSWHDQSGITVHARITGVGVPVIVDSRRGRWSETEILDQLIELSYIWNLSTWAIEAIAAQRLLIPLFRLLLTERKIPPEAITIVPVSTNRETKASRIMAFRKAMNSRSYGLSENQIDLRLLLEEYTPDTKEDDIQDSSAYGPLIWQLYGVTVEALGVIGIAGRLLQTTESNQENLGELDVCAV